jgi:predicted RNase H-like nuclease (RuvC/YqgF family)
VARLQAEIGRLREEIDRRQAEFGQQQQEFTRVSASHAVEIAQMRNIHATETNLLRTEIHHLRHVVEEYRSRLYWLRMLYKMYKIGAAGVISCFRPVVGRHR